jgi:7,8-dihydropterin-6-yl-methyl-4-(beta-D-ribofuranosyl)aminobenzene 5'-phosphate synthase
MTTRIPPLLIAVVVLAALPAASAQVEGEITLTDIYDNYLFSASDSISISQSGYLGTHWGLSCLIEGTQETILFDTGYHADVLQANIGALNIDLGGLDLLVTSHNHPDHIAGIPVVLQYPSITRAYFGMSFAAPLADMLVTVDGVQRATPIRVGEPLEICPGVWASGDLSGSPNEQFLILDTRDGLVVLTGCAHPGVASTVQRAEEVLGKNVYMLIGGFHLLTTPAGTVAQIIQDLQALGVRKVAPSHCTGDEAIALFKAAYGDSCLAMGEGRKVTLNSRSTAVTEELASGVPDQFGLDQNHPNPFNSSTVIRFSLPARAEVELAVYSLLGQRVVSLARGTREAGSYTVTWDGRDARGNALASGMYLYRLQAGSQVEARKLLLVR